MSDHHDELIERIAAELRRAAPSDPAARARIMAAVRRPTWWHRRAPWQWLVVPLPVRVTPLHLLAATLVMIAALASVRTRRTVAPPTRAAAPIVGVAPMGPQIVQFVFVAPAASHVSLVGDFNDWDVEAAPMRRAGAPGVWSIAVSLAPGRHVYAFVVDGTKWQVDPSAPRAPGDDFGTPNSVIVVGATT